MCPEPDKAARSQLDQCRLALLMCLGHRHGPKSHDLHQLACGDTRADQPKYVLLKALDERRLGEQQSERYPLSLTYHHEISPVCNPLERQELVVQQAFCLAHVISGIQLPIASERCFSEGFVLEGDARLLADLYHLQIAWDKARENAPALYTFDGQALGHAKGLVQVQYALSYGLGCHLRDFALYHGQAVCHATPLENANSTLGHLSDSLPRQRVFCAQLLEKERVAAVPGSAFGAEGYLRLSYATSDQTIAKGVARLAAFCSRLKK